MRNICPLTGSPAIKILQISFDPRVTKDPFQFSSVKHVSIGRINDEENLCHDLKLFATKIKNLDFLVLDQVKCTETLINNGLQAFMEKFGTSLKAILVIYSLDKEKLESRCPLELITRNCPQLYQIYSLQTHFKEAWILYGTSRET